MTLQDYLEDLYNKLTIRFTNISEDFFATKNAYDAQTVMKEIWAIGGQRKLVRDIYLFMWGEEAFEEMAGRCFANDSTLRD